MCWRSILKFTRGIICFLLIISCVPSYMFFMTKCSLETRDTRRGFIKGKNHTMCDARIARQQVIVWTAQWSKGLKSNSSYNWYKMYKADSINPHTSVAFTCKLVKSLTRNHSRIFVPGEIIWYVCTRPFWHSPDHLEFPWLSSVCVFRRAWNTRKKTDLSSSRLVFEEMSF